jgi:molybdopterin converting factor small subunit
VAVGQVYLRLFGLGREHAGQVQSARPLEPGTTVLMLWEGLRREAAPGDRMATIDEEGLLVLVNGHPLRTRAEWHTQLAEGDTVTYMPKAFGG